MDERTERIGRNEALFRDVNARLEGLNETFATFTETFEIVCECGHAACTEQLAVPTDVYGRVRADPALFMIVPQHVLPETESVVERQDGFAIVRKDPGRPEEIAKATAPD